MKTVLKSTLKVKVLVENLAKNIAIKVKRIRKPVALEPMNPYERRIIHTAVQKVRGATSWSEGENMNRHVVIGPDPDARPRYDRRNNNNNRGTVFIFLNCYFNFS